MDQIAPKLDAQQVEIAGRNLLVSLFLADNVEVSQPLRDNGIDLIAFKHTTKGGKFRAAPIQLKASSVRGFSLNKKYEGMLLAYVWHVVEPLNAEVFVMTYEQARNVADSSAFERVGQWSNTHPSQRMLKAMEPFRYRPGYLSTLIDGL